MKEKAVKVGHHSGRELYVRLRNDNHWWLRVRIYSAGQRFYHLQVTGSSKAINGREADLFLRSFRLSPDR
jgi:hypothetical protein